MDPVSTSENNAINVFNRYYANNVANYNSTLRRVKSSKRGIFRRSQSRPNLHVAAWPVIDVKQALVRKNNATRKVYSVGQNGSEVEMSPSQLEKVMEGQAGGRRRTRAQTRRSQQRRR